MLSLLLVGLLLSSLFLLSLLLVGLLLVGLLLSLLLLSLLLVGLLLSSLFMFGLLLVRLNLAVGWRVIRPSSLFRCNGSAVVQVSRFWSGRDRRLAVVHRSTELLIGAGSLDMSRLGSYRRTCLSRIAASSRAVGRAVVPPLPPLKLAPRGAGLLITVVLYTLWILVTFTLLTERL